MLAPRRLTVPAAGACPAGLLDAELKLVPATVPAGAVVLKVANRGFTVKGIAHYQSGDYPPAEPEFGGDYGEEGQLTIV